MAPWQLFCVISQKSIASGANDIKETEAKHILSVAQM